jgi:hypothetical protein
MLAQQWPDVALKIDRAGCSRLGVFGLNPASGQPVNGQPASSQPTDYRQPVGSTT